MNRRVALGGSLAGLILASGLSPSQARADTAGADPNFDGKYVSIFLKSVTNSSVHLENVHFTRLADRPFPVGNGIRTEHPSFSEYAGIVNWVAVEDISLMQVFSDIEGLLEHFDALQG